MLKDMAAAAEPWAVAATAISKAAVELAARLAATVLASVAENKCDDLAAMYQLLLSPGPVQDRVEAGVAGCGAALPSLSPTEVYTEAGDPGPGLDTSTRAAQGGRPSHPLPGLQSPPPQFTQLHHKEILPQINLPQNLPLQQTLHRLLREDPGPAASPALAWGRRASNCDVYSLLVPGRRPSVRPMKR